MARVQHLKQAYTQGITRGNSKRVKVKTVRSPHDTAMDYLASTVLDERITAPRRDWAAKMILTATITHAIKNNANTRMSQAALKLRGIDMNAKKGKGKQATKGKKKEIKQAEAVAAGKNSEWGDDL